MALNEDDRDETVERDPRLERLYQAAAGEEPPAALDAAILAAARREVHAGPQVAGGNGEAAGAATRQKRSWYVPVSLAAVLVLSVSVVTLVHQEKGDELAQPPPTANTPRSLPPPTQPDGMLRDAAPAKPKVAQVPQAEPPPGLVAPKAAGELAKKEGGPPEIRESKASSVEGPGMAARRDQRPGESANTPAAAPSPQSAPMAPLDGPSASSSGLRSGAAAPGAAGGRVGAAPPPPGAAVSERRPEPFPVAPGRDAVAQSGAEPAQARLRSEVDRPVTQGAIAEAPKAASPALSAAAPRAPSSGDDAQTLSAPAPAAKTGLRRGVPPLPTQPLWLKALDNQPPEKWLETLAEFKRDGNVADADRLLAEFRRRFPDHPGSKR